MNYPMIGCKYKIVGKLDKSHRGNTIGDIIECTNYEILDNHCEFQSKDLFWDGTKLQYDNWGFGIVPYDIEQTWDDVLELIEE
ncbi:hypothetical protein HPMBJEAJ_00142 [Aeromonas phage avDM6]|nr:hypothetical protein HPMBJEAJ_00142 [Aeromonas phage avDM6]